jgi:hypothetical protein
LNPGDQITLSLITTSEREGALSVKARVSGVKQVRLESSQAEGDGDGATGALQLTMSLLAGVAALMTVMMTFSRFILRRE